MALEVSTEEKVRFLSSPGSYPGLETVDVEETHMSWVFLVGPRVYKLKKPVRYPFLDFSTIEARKANCLEEMRLNRRLAPDVYLGVVPLTCDPDGRLAIGGQGQPVDWLVLMRRLPAHLMLDRRIGDGSITEAEIVVLADLLSDFYRDAARAETSAADYVGQFEREHRQNWAVLTDSRFPLDAGTTRRALDVADRVIRSRHLLEERVSSQRVLDGHGDLRPEHVCLEAPPVIYDCLEFNRSLRMVDAIDELSFLGMECHFLGNRWIGGLLLSRYSEASGDRPPRELAEFYRCYRACLRARLSLVHLIEGDKRKPEKWLPQAARYVSLAIE